MKKSGSTETRLTFRLPLKFLGLLDQMAKNTMQSRDSIITKSLVCMLGPLVLKGDGGLLFTTAFRERLDKACEFEGMTRGEFAMKAIRALVEASEEDMAATGACGLSGKPASGKGGG